LHSVGIPKHLLPPLLEQLLFGVPLFILLLLLGISECGILLESGILIEVSIVGD